MVIEHGHLVNPLEVRFYEIFGLPIEIAVSEEEKLNGERSDRRVFLAVLDKARANEGITGSQIDELSVLWMQDRLSREKTL